MPTQAQANSADEVGPMLVVIRHRAHRQRPGDREARIVMPDSEGGGDVGFGDEIVDVGIVGQGLETVGKLGRNVELTAVVA